MTNPDDIVHYRQLPFKKVWLYGFKVHMLVTLLGYTLNYLVTPASVHDLIEGCQQSVILADLGYLSHELKADLATAGYDLWTPLRQNMKGTMEHHHWKLMAMRRTFETRFSDLVWLFDSEHTLARG